MTGALMGKHIVNTRAAHQAEKLSALLRAQGAEPLEYPCIAIVPPYDISALDASLSDLAAGHYDWLVLTSANTVFAIAQRLAALNLSLAKSTFRTAAVGPATAEAAQQIGLHVADVPEEYSAEALVASLPVVAGARVLLPESAIARPALAAGLAARGAKVMVINAYKTVKGQGGVNVPELLAEKQIDALTFTSSSTVTYFLERLNAEGGKLDDALNLHAACLGAKTALTARDIGFKHVNAATENTLDSLVDALAAHFTGDL